MATTIFIYYRGAKTRSFRTMERISVYMEDFVYGDIKALGLPRPSRHDCVYAERAGAVKCWFPDADYDFDERLDDAFAAIRPEALCDLSIATVSMLTKSRGGKPTYISAPGVRNRGARVPNREKSPVSRSRRASGSRARRSSPTGESAPPPHSRRRSRSRSRQRSLRGPQYDDDERRETTTRETSRRERSREELRSYRDRETESGYARRDTPYRPRQGRRIDEVLQRLDDINTSLTTVSSGLTNTRDDPVPPVLDRVVGTSSSVEVEVPLPPALSSPARPSPPTSTPRACEDTVKVETREIDEPPLSGPSSAPPAEAPVEPCSPSLLATAPTSPATSVFSVRSASSEATSASTSSMPGGPAVDIDDVRRELQDVLQQISALAARESALVARLGRLGASGASGPHSAFQIKGAEESAGIDKDGSAATSDSEEVLDSEVEALRFQLHAALEERRAAAYAAYDERQRRVAAENALADVRRECSAPFVVPALMDALIGISALADAFMAVDDIGAGV